MGGLRGLEHLGRNPQLDAHAEPKPHEQYTGLGSTSPKDGTKLGAFGMRMSLGFRNICYNV